MTPTMATTTTVFHRSSISSSISSSSSSISSRLFSTTSNGSSSSNSNSSINTFDSPVAIPSALRNRFDVIVVGGGHAGVEAAAAAARTGAITALVTQRLDTVGELSCNPSIGGIGKGHLVREIDALQGLQGVTADAAGIHYRVLNRRKGPAVRGPRAQMDRDLYKQAMQETLSEYPNLYLVQAAVQDLLLDESTAGSGIESMAPMAARSTSTLLGQQSKNSSNKDSANTENTQQVVQADAAAVHSERQARIRGVLVTADDGSSHEISSRAVVITTGTFLRGVLLMGHDRYAGGRHLRDSEQVEPPSVGLAQTLARFKFPLGRLKTGTPARLDGKTIDWDTLVIQPSERPAQPFSHLLQFNGEQPPMLAADKVIDCYQTATNVETHKLVMEYEHLLPQYDGLDGAGNGPRYCPSIYKKVQRFTERNSHNCFLEPEGLDSDIVYPNGMSGPYPAEIQLKIMRSMKGLGAVEIVRPGYDVEYDFVNPQALTHTLETKKIGGLYLAGQICGTTGYEEAAAQGIVAGANAGKAAAAATAGEKPPLPFVIGRDEGYIGVLIDDLVTRGTNEPYRMFTSRAEYRISLRADNADMRLTRKGMEFGLVHDEERISALDAREFLIDDRINTLRNFKLKVTDWSSRGGNDLMGGAQSSRKPGNTKTAEEILIMPHVTLKAVEDIMIQVTTEEANAAETVSSGGDEVSGFDEMDAKVIVPATASPASVYDTVEASIKYQSYVRRQYKDMESWRRAQGQRIPPDVVYDHGSLPTLSLEELEKLNVNRPNTFAEASQISGITPQSLVYLYHHVQRRNKQRDGRAARPPAKQILQ